LHHYEYGFFSRRWHDYVAYNWGHRNPPGRDPALIRDKIEDGMVDPNGDRLIEHMDSAGIDLGVVEVLDWEIGFRDPAPVSIEGIHEAVARVIARHSDRLVGFAGIDPQRENAVQLFEWAVRDLGYRGLKLYPNTGFYPYDERVFPLYERCEQWGLPILCHAGGPGIALLPARFANPIFLQDVQARFPRLKLWIAHAGHRIYREEAAAVAAAGVHTYLELSAWEKVVKNDEEFYVRWLGSVRDQVGAHRLIWGSDHFAGTRVRGKESLLWWTEWFRQLPATAEKYGVRFTQEEVDRIMGTNALECLRLDTAAAS
jgi:predicted TIM-barrel fold metal-dependent hydrolase